MAERPDGTMDVGLCEILSREYSLLLDVQQPITSHYTLEVSFAGIDRPLTRFKDFIKWSGFETKIECHVGINGRQKFKGIFKSNIIK